MERHPQYDRSLRLPSPVFLVLQIRPYWGPYSEASVLWGHICLTDMNTPRFIQIWTHWDISTHWDITLPTKVHLVKSMVFPVVNMNVRVGLQESWALKNWCFWTVVLEKTLESPLACKEIQPAHPKGDQLWVFSESTDIEAETPGLWPPDAKSWLIWTDPDAGKDFGQQENGVTEDGIVGWHHWLNGCEFKQTLGDSEGQRSPECCSLWGYKELDRT